MILLSSVLDSWFAVTVVGSSVRSTKLKLNDIRDLVLSEDIHRRESSDSHYLHLIPKSGERQSKRTKSWSWQIKVKEKREIQKSQGHYLLELR